jgi:16S rRNA (adenine1518-N6/adenine1519-N6)-dimethyltransferase
VNPAPSEPRDCAAPEDPPDESGLHGVRRPQWALVREQLEQAGFRPSRRLGQNLLQDGNMARAIVRDARVGRGEFVLEIGAGAGFLTLHLAAAGVELLAVEIDERLLAIARRLVEEGAPGASVSWLHADALAGKHELHPELVARLPRSGPWHVVSNLPYSVGSPLLVLLSQLANPPTSMTVLLQRELAQRITGAPGSKSWGPLAIRLQLGYRCELVRAVPPQLFWPRPEVESNLLRLELRGQRPAREEAARLDELLELVFRHRRQALSRSLSEPLGGRAPALEFLASFGLEPATRPEDVGSETWLAMGRDPRWQSSKSRRGELS